MLTTVRGLEFCSGEVELTILVLRELSIQKLYYPTLMQTKCTRVSRLI